MLGFSTIEDAKQGYLVHYPDGWVGFGGIEEISFKDLAFPLHYQNMRNQQKKKVGTRNIL